MLKLWEDKELYKEIQKNEEIAWKELNPAKNNERLLKLIREKENI